MTQPNGSVLVTPGVGETVAVHDVGGKGFQAVMIAHASGHLRGTIPTYYFNRPFTAGAGSQRTIDIFNASGSGVVLKVRKIFLFHDQTAITGVGHRFEVHRTSAVGTAGTAITGVSVDTANPAIPAQVTARYNATGGATQTAKLFDIGTNPEETLAAASVHAGLNWVPEGEDIQEIVIREGEGLVITQITANTAGLWTCLLVVTIE